MRLFKNSRNQNGIASLVVTVVLVALLSTIAVAFAILMNRELNKSLQNQIGQAAYDAAESGINDAISYIRDNPNTNVTRCQDLIGPGKALSGASILSADGATKYTCLLINTKPLDLVYQSIPANKSEVVKVTTSAPTSKLMVSWQASDRSQANFIPTGQIGSLLDETNWKSGRYTPLLQVSLYPVPADTKDASFATANSRTYFLYPGQSTSSTVGSMSYSAGTGTLEPVSCGVNATNGTFNGTADYDCNLIITNLPTGDPSGYIYYLRVMPVYGSADFKVRADDTTGLTQPVQFIDTQAIVDVTAQSSAAVKRLQARVDISGLNGTSQDIAPGDDTFPQYAVQTPDAVCKRIQVSNLGPSFPDYFDDNSVNYCGVPSLSKLKPPVVHAGQASNVQTDSATLNGTVNPNNGTVDQCYFQVSTSQGGLNGAAQNNCDQSVGSGTSTVAVTYTVTGLNAGTQYYFQICAHNQAGTNCDSGDGSSTGAFGTLPPPTCDNGATNYPDCDNNGGGGGGDPYLTSFSQPSAADCNARYGFSHSNNCFDWSGGNLPGSCEITLDGADDGSFGSGPDGGSVTLGNGPAGSGHIQCGSAGCDLGQACAPAQPPPPGPVISSYRIVAWDEGPNVCNSSAGARYAGSWYCRNNASTYGPYPCADGVHRWVSCPDDPNGNDIQWSVYNQSTTCDLTSSYGSLFTDQRGNFSISSTEGWPQNYNLVNSGNPNGTFSLTCTASDGTRQTVP